MLPRKDVDRLFHLALKKGALGCELYSESSQRLTCQFKDRLAHTASQHTGGSVLLMSFPFGPRKLFSSFAGTSGLEDLLEGKFDLSVSLDSPRSSSHPTDPHVQKTFRSLDKALKRAQLDCSSIKEIELSYSDEDTQFLYADTDGRYAPGRRAQAEWKGSALLVKDDRSVRIQTQRASSDRDLAATLEESPLFSETQLKNSFQPCWPFPMGELATLWSSTALSKLIFLLGRSLEGDLALRNQSWISSIKMPSLRFSVLEHAGSADAFDHEGSPQPPMVLIDRGAIRSVMTDRQSASALGICSTGNSRRASCLLPATLAASRLEITGTECEEDLLSKIQAGVMVDDIRIRHFDLETSEVQLELTDTRLIHHGSAGDKLEPTLLQIHLPDLLSSFRAFGTASERKGIWLVKNQNRLLVEILTPPALSHGLTLPGTVPSQNYW